MLNGPFERDYVIDPRYGSSPIPVVYSDGACYLSSTDPDGPEPIEVERDRLREYHLDTGRFLEALAAVNDMDPLVELRTSGLWQVGHWQHGQDDLLVLFAPACFDGQLPREIAEAEKLSQGGRTLLLVPFRSCIDGNALELDRRRVLTLVLENALDIDLKLQLPDLFLRARLELDCTRRLAHWEGQLLDMRDADFPILEQLARDAGGVVRKKTLIRAGDQRRTEEAVRKSIMYLRETLRKADPAIDEEASKQIVRTVTGLGYQLSLSRKEVRLLE